MPLIDIRMDYQETKGAEELRCAMLGSGFTFNVLAQKINADDNNEQKVTVCDHSVPEIDLSQGYLKAQHVINCDDPFEQQNLNDLYETFQPTGRDVYSKLASIVREVLIRATMPAPLIWLYSYTPNQKTNTKSSRAFSFERFPDQVASSIIEFLYDLVDLHIPPDFLSHKNCDTSAPFFILLGENNDERRIELEHRMERRMKLKRRFNEMLTNTLTYIREYCYDVGNKRLISCKNGDHTDGHIRWNKWKKALMEKNQEEIDSIQSTMTTDSITFNHILGQGRVNQLGGVFINGRPLPLQIREAIISMAKQGIKPCHISRQLKVSHGAVSKILNRYAETGSISPGQIGGNPRARLTVQAVEKQLIIAFEENPHMSASELREVLIQKEVCTRSNVPSANAISKMIRSRGLLREKKMERKRLSYSIDSILGISIDECNKSSSDDDECSSTSPSSATGESARRNRTSFTSDQLDALEAAFKANTYPDAVEREAISKETGLSEEKIMTWFSNRRARCRKHIPAYQQMYNSTSTFGASTSPVAALQYHQMLAQPLLFNPLLFPTTNFLQTTTTGNDRY
ncbi:unnamed protein product [Caenorhabditis bovis]|uniref:Uncharacterized protein n=1 Tax=Caenorhabditis bovis TaxID=2654633 RepID=A0A8S1EYM9_9PELO|nr:unnamed protein product [Caenorhabditis bovis]